MVSKKVKEASVIAEQKARDMMRIGADELRTTAYVRTSTDDPTQDKRRQLKGLTKVLKEFPQCKPLPLYVETGSGRGGYERKQFNKMMGDAAMNRFDALLVWEVDRFGRDFYEGQNKVKELFDMGISVYFCDLALWFDANNDLHKIMLALHFMMADSERKKISKRSREGTEGMKEDLEVFTEENNCVSIRKGGRAGIFEMVCNDTSIPAHKKAKQNKAKKGLMYVEVPYLREIYKLMWMEGLPVKDMQNMFRKPVNHKCKNKCWNGKKMPFNQFPTRDNVTLDKAYTDWTKYVKPVEELAKSALVTSGARKGKRNCNCARAPTSKTISVTNKEMGLPLRHETAFRSDKIVSEEVSWDDVLATGGTIKSG